MGEGSAGNRRAGLSLGEPGGSVTCELQQARAHQSPRDGRHPTGASPYGVIGMGGNVGEWTRSLKWTSRPGENSTLRFGYPYQSGDGREDMDASLIVRRVRRGGSYAGGEVGARVARRGPGSVPSNGSVFIGFRVVLSQFSLDIWISDSCVLRTLIDLIGSLHPNQLSASRKTPDFGTPRSV